MEPEIRIGHIGDTHIGQRGAAARTRRIVEDIAERFEPGEIVVCHTGDFTEAATARQLRQADQIFSLLAEYKTKGVAGNHGVGNGVSYSTATAARTGDFLGRFNGEPYEGGVWRWDDPGSLLTIIGINTSAEPSILARGLVGYNQLLDVARHCSAATSEGRVVVAMAHHSPKGGNASLRLDDRFELLHTLAHRCSMLLFGHLHEALSWSGVYGLDRMYATDKTSDSLRYRVIEYTEGVWRDRWIDLE